jgi:hypothetical protein
MGWNWDLGVVCSECGGSLWEDDERAFCFAPGEFLCWDCAIAHGGVYDPQRQTWTTPPDLRAVRLGESAQGAPQAP